jgi:hypothetical protein
LAAVALLGTALVASALPALADTTPGLFTSDSLLLRGGSTNVWGGGLSPSTGYELIADHGSINSSGTSAAVTTMANGTFHATFTMTTDIAPDVASVTISVVDGSNSTVATATIIVDTPEFSGIACPGQPIGQPYPRNPDGSYQTGVSGLGFPDGSYTLSSDFVTFTHATVTSTDGLLIAGGRASNALPASFSVTATLNGTTGPWTYTWNRDEPRASASARTPWTLALGGACFAPGETVRLTAHDAHTTAPATVTADSQGRVSVDGRLHPATSPTYSLGVNLSGLGSGQTADTEAVAIPGTSLQTGEALTPGPNMSIVSPAPGYQFSEMYCGLGIWAVSPDGMSARWWVDGISAHGKCRLILRSGGNLVLYSDDGKVAWATHTAGTSHGNQLRMRTDGIAAIYTATSAIIWTNADGRVGAPGGALLLAGRALRRGQHVQNGNSQLALRANGDLVVVRANHTVWDANTAGRGAVRLVMRPDGNLVLADSQGHPVWSSRTAGTGTHNRAVVLPDGDVAVLTAGSKRLWHTNTGI